MIQTILEVLGAVVAALLASGGYWSYKMSKNNHKTAESKMLMGLAHDRIVELGMKYIERGTITRDEYENLYDISKNIALKNDLTKQSLTPENANEEDTGGTDDFSGF